jgi:hypothetical protein
MATVKVWEWPIPRTGLRCTPHAAAAERRRRGFSWRCALGRWIRVLIWGRCWWSIHHGGIHSGKPAELIRQDQPFCRKWVW